MKETAKKVHDQKVYVTLASVTKLQEALRSEIERVKGITDSKNSTAYRYRASGLAQAIRILGLPIEITKGF